MKWVIFGLLFACSASRAADPKVFLFTMDNDIFVDDDSGYSNGFYFSWLRAGEDKDKLPRKSLVAPLIWSYDPAGNKATTVVNSFGHVINTPEDLTVAIPDEDSLPYSGLLFYNSSFLSIHEEFVDSLSTTIGVVGPLSGAESTHKWVHKITGSDEPQGWSTQLENELVFQFARGRLWRSWVAQGKDFDLLLNSEASLGTLQSDVSVGLTVRYGKGLEHSYASHLLAIPRISNPFSLNNNWSVFLNLNARYLFNQIFLDGNTFTDSRSVDYDHGNVGIGVGFSKAWKKFSISFVVNDNNVNPDSSEEQLGEITRYGSITMAWIY